MPDNESALLVPLRSNANALLTGTPIAALRRRLKFASLFYDRVYLEAGIFRMRAGPTGSFSVLEPADPRNPPRWQTPSQRHAEQAGSFAVGIGREHTPGVLAAPTATAVSSTATASWTATLQPFADEIRPGTDWIEFARTRNPTSEADRLARQWTREDEHNASLERAVPEYFVRNAIIDNANRDLAVAAEGQVAVAVDPLHAQVARQRFRDDDTWKLPGYAVPIVFPRSATCPGTPSPTSAATGAWPGSGRSSEKSKKKP